MPAHDLDCFATATERRIATQLVDYALRRGYAVSVYDGAKWTVRVSTDRQSILNALASSGSDTLRFRDASGAHMGDVLLVWGNGADLVSDYTDNEAMRTLVG